MKPGRNDPCPCGSGRKYKQCCQEAEGSAGRAPLSGALARVVRETAAREPAWAAEVVPLAIDVGREPAQRPAAVLITAGELVVYHDLRVRVGGEVEQVVELIESAVLGAGRQVGSLPQQVLVRHEEVAAGLRACLEPREIEVASVPELPELAEAARGLMENVSGAEHWPPVGSVQTWGGWGLPPRLVKEIFAAAADFWRRAPWKVMDDLDTPELITASGRRWTALVLGDAGLEFGLALHSEPADLAHLMLGEPGSFEGVRGRILSLTFDRGAELPPAMRREIVSERWPVASAEAHPVLFTVNAPGGGLSLGDAEDLVAALRAIPAFAEADDGALRQVKSIDDLLEPITWRDPATGVTLTYSDPHEALLDEADDLDFEPNPIRSELDQKMRAVVAEVVREMGEDADMEEVTAEIQRRVAALEHEHNNTPQEDLVGLAPVQVHQLISADLTEPGGPLRVSAELDPAAVDGAPLLRDLRLLVELAAERGGLSATTTGKLKVKVVARLLGRFETAAWSRDRYGPGDRCWEEDVPAVHRVRILAELAELIELRRSKFEATALGRELIEPERSGELFAALFRAYFGGLNLDYLAIVPWPELQHQIAVTFYGLSQMRYPATAAELFESAVLPFARNAAPDSFLPDYGARHLAGHVLEPLVEMGLLERSDAGEGGNVDDRAYVKTPLFDQLLHFDLGAGG